MFISRSRRLRYTQVATAAKSPAAKQATVSLAPRKWLPPPTQGAVEGGRFSALYRMVETSEVSLLLSLTSASLANFSLPNICDPHAH